MEQGDSRQSRREDEIDIGHIFKLIGRAFTRFGQGLFFGVATLRYLFIQNRLFFAIVIIVGLVFGGVYVKLIRKDVYRTSMILSSDYHNPRLLESIFNKINQLADQKDKTALAQLLQIDEKTATSIKKFTFEPFMAEDDLIEIEVLREQLMIVSREKQVDVDGILDRLKTANKRVFEISAAVYDPQVIKELESALVNYLKKSDYVNNRLMISRQLLLERRKKLAGESAKLDSLKGILYSNYIMMPTTSRGSGNVYLGDDRIANPLDVFERDLSLNTEILAIDRELHLNSGFEMVDGFAPFEEPTTPGFGASLAIAFVISLLLGYLILAISALDRVLTQYYEEKMNQKSRSS